MLYANRANGYMYKKDLLKSSTFIFPFFCKTLFVFYRNFSVNKSIMLNFVKKLEESLFLFGNIILIYFFW